MEIIKSRDNPKIKYAIKLSKSASFRKEEKKFFAASKKVVFDLIEFGYDLEFLFLSLDEYEKNKENIIEEKTFVITNDVAEKLSPDKSPMQIYAVFKMREENASDILKKDKILVLEDIQDPQNVGAIMRTALAFDFKDVVVSNKTADVYSYKVLRSSMTASAKLNIYKVDDFKNFTKKLNENSFTTIAACLLNAINLKAAKKPEKTALFIGNEGNGLSRDVLDNALLKVKIEMSEDIESLNAAVSAAVLMWEFK